MSSGAPVCGGGFVIFEGILPRLRSQTESPYIQTVPDKTCLSPDRPRRNAPMSRLSCVQKYLCVLRAFKTPYVQTSCVQNFIWPDFSAFQIKISALICGFMSRILCVQKHLCPDFRAFKMKIRALICAFMPELSCVQKHPCPFFCAFKNGHVQTLRSCSDNVFIKYSFQV